MKKIFTICCLFLFVFMLTKTTVRAQNRCFTKITKDDMEFLLEGAAPTLLKGLENPEKRKKQIESLRVMMALACAASKSFINDSKITWELEDIRIQLIAVNYDREINKDKGAMPPFGYIGQDRIKKFWENYREVDFNKYLALSRGRGQPVPEEVDRQKQFTTFLDAKMAIAKEQGKIAADRGPSEEEIRDAKEYFAKTRIYAEEAQLKWAKLPAEFKRKIDLSVKLQQAEYLSRLYAERVLAGKTRVSEEEVEAYIAKHPELGTTSQKEKAEKILQRVLAGEDFAKLAREFSEDPGSKDKGGLYADVPKGQMVPEFEQAALALKPGQIAPNLVESKFGYHIIKLIKKGMRKGSDGKEIEIYDVRHIMILTTIENPNNSDGPQLSRKEFVRSKLEEEKENKLLAQIVEENPVEVAEDFEVPKMSDEQMRKMTQQQMQIPQIQGELKNYVLPAKVKKYLNLNYRGWKLASTSDFCSEEYRRNVISGDFDGDGKTDYGAKIIRGKKGFVLVFLARNNNYAAHILHTMTASEIVNTALGVFRKGEKYTPGDEEAESSSAIVLKTDAPFDGPCASDTGGIHLYRNGKFIAY